MSAKLKINCSQRKEPLAPDLNILPPLPELEDDLYIHDADFKPRQEVSRALPPGSPQSALEREILRRLLYTVNKRAITRIEDLASLCPKGLALEDATKYFLSNAPASMEQQKARESALWFADYVTQPPTMAEFLSDPQYLGASLGGRGQDSGLWPAWQTLLVNQFDLDSFVHNVVLTGGIGIGKTLILVLLVLYRICLVAHLRDPRRFFGLSPGGSISFVIMSVTKETVRATAWQQALRWMQRSPFFCDDTGFDPARSYSDLRVELRSLTANGHGTQLVLSGGSQPQHLIGRDTLVIAMDEGNLRLDADPQFAARQIFADMRARMASRFQLRSGFMPGLSVVASSAEDESAFTEGLIKEIARFGDPVTDVVIRRAIYRLKPGMSLKPWSFRVVYGLPNAEPRILSGAFADNGQPIDPPADCPFSGDDKAEAVPNDMMVELVPGDYLEVFQRNPRRALQQLSGIAVGGTHRLFATLRDIEKCIEVSTLEGHGNPLRSSTISVSDENTDQIWDALIHGVFLMQVGRGIGPKRHPTSPRFAHLDLATTGKAGLAICHLVSVTEPSGTGGQSGAGLGVPVVVEFDLILTLARGRERPIAFDKIRGFLFWLRKEGGYCFSKITADMYQSDYLLETLASNGFSTAKLSVDRSPDAYHALRAGFEASAVRLYRQEEFITEARELLEIDGKIDHPPGSTKDTTDAVAGAYFNAITSDEARRLLVRHDPPVLLGIQPKGGNATPEDPFGFYTSISPRPIRSFIG